MAVITLPADFKFGAECGMGQQRYDLLSASPATGADQVGVMGPPRWTLNLVQPTVLRLQDAAVWQALLVSLRGRVNVLAAWDPAMTKPNGTARGAMTLKTDLAGNYTVAVISGCAPGSTLAIGDRLQLASGVGSSQLVMVMAPTTANAAGDITVTFEPPTRIAFAAGTAVAWDKPVAYFRARSSSTSWSYAKKATVATGMALDLLETFTP